MYFTDRGVEELATRRGEEEVTLAWLAERLSEFSDVHPEFETAVERLATWLARSTTLTTTTEGQALETRGIRRFVPNGHATSEWPVGMPAVDQVLRDGFEVSPGVTLLYGENGAGKSTLVEAFAVCFGLSSEGGTPFAQHHTRESESPLHRWLGMERDAGASRWGFFLRAESMHGLYTYLEGLGGDGRPPLHEMSHAESFLEVLRTRFDSPGFYCLDEPEAALSFSGQLALLGTMHDLAAGGSQIVCATHSPLLASLPGARLLEVGEWGIRETAYDDLALVRHWRDYLAEPMRYLRHVLE